MHVNKNDVAMDSMLQYCFLQSIRRSRELLLVYHDLVQAQDDTYIRSSRLHSVLCMRSRRLGHKHINDPTSLNPHDSHACGARVGEDPNKQIEFPRVEEVDQYLLA